MIQNQMFITKSSLARTAAKAEGAERDQLHRVADIEDGRHVTIGRIVVGGKPGDALQARAMLLQALNDCWGQDLHLKFLITPGGFVSAPFPSEWNGAKGWKSSEVDLYALVRHAEKILLNVVTDKVRKAAKGKVDVLTIGIDLSSGKRFPHAELVAVCDLRNEQTFWTGKSYPTNPQQRRLVQVVDLKTHLLEIAGERVLVIGCHDLNMFSPRGDANRKPGSRRFERSNDMRRLVDVFKPTIVLHHPHTTDSPNIWSTAWSRVKERKGPFSEVKAWASGIAYFNPKDPKGVPRSTIEKVLKRTHGGIAPADLRVHVR